MTNESTPSPQAPVIVIMGVTGSGKTTVGEMLAKRLELPFHDADDFHSEENREKLAEDVPLSDADREPWLDMLVSKVTEWAAGGGAVLACSALKHSYRSRFRRAALTVKFVFLDGDPTLIVARLRERADQGDHVISNFEAILLGQYRDLEIPTDALRVAIHQTPEQIVADIVEALAAQSTFNN